jgi:thioredoxin 1
VAQVLTLSDAGFMETAMTSDLALISVNPTWCAPSKLLAPTLEALATDYERDLVVGKLDSDRHYELAQRLGVRTTPTLLLLRHGKVLKTWFGHQHRRVFDDELDKHVQHRVRRHTPVTADQLSIAKVKFAEALKEPPERLADMIATYSLTARTGRTERLRDCVDAARQALRTLLWTVELLEDTVPNEGRPTYQRLGALNALHYFIYPLDFLDDNLAGGYGYLDDWLILNAARFLYAERASPDVMRSMANLTTLVWDSLPEPSIPGLVQRITFMGFEEKRLATLADADIRPVLDQLVAAPAIVQLLLPPPERTAFEQAHDRALGGWSPHADSAIWGSGEGRDWYMSFANPTG